MTELDPRVAAERRARELAARRKALRVEQEMRCTHDGRVVAAVVIDESDRLLWIVGGGQRRDGARLDEVETDHARSSSRATEGGRLGDYYRKRAEFLAAYAEELRQPVIAGTAGPLEIRPGVTSEYEAPCPHCHRNYKLVVSPESITLL